MFSTFAVHLPLIAALWGIIGSYGNGEGNTQMIPDYIIDRLTPKVLMFLLVARDQCQSSETNSTTAKHVVKALRWGMGELALDLLMRQLQSDRIIHSDKEPITLEPFWVDPAVFPKLDAFARSLPGQTGAD
ncbi:MAG: hypothetical protein ABI670_08910 [Chloroflexota bacterium]